MMRFILFSFLIVGLGACQTSSQRKIASEEIMQVRVLPTGTKIKFAQSITFRPGASSISLMENVSDPTLTRCTFGIARTVKPSERLQLAQNSEYMISEVSVSPTYDDVTGADGKIVTNIPIVKTTYKIKKTGDPTSTPIAMTCEDCPFDTTTQTVKTGCSNSPTARIEAFFASLSHKLIIGDGPSVINLPKQTTIVPIKYEDSAQDLPNPVAL